MIKSELLEEKYRVQKEIAKECESVKEYLERSSSVAEDIAKSYGFSIKYVNCLTKHSSGRHTAVAEFGR